MSTSINRFVVLCASAALLCAASVVQGQTYTVLHAISSGEGGTTNYPGLMAQGRDGNLYGTTTGGNSANAYGSIFKMTPDGSFQLIYTFSGKDGALPTSGLTLATDGNFYGTTESGGLNSFGTIFKITPAGTRTNLYDFTGSTDGGYPFGPPVQGKNGTFYGTTLLGTSYSITSLGTFKPLSNLPGPCYGPLLLASDGNLYGTSAQGGTTGNGTVFRLSASGVVTLIYNFDGTHGSAPYGGLVQGSDGLLYGTTTSGGSIANPGGVVFKVTLGGSITVLHQFDSTSTTDGDEPVAGLVLASDGNFYGSTSQGANGPTVYGTLFKISRTGAYSVLHVFDQTNGATPSPTEMQHTNGLIYGTAVNSSITNADGVIYSLNNSLKANVAPVTQFGAPGQSVQILGTGLIGATGVSFGTGSATFKVVSDTFMTAVVPTNGTTGVITVTRPSGTLISNKKFMVTPLISSFTPSSGPVGTQVTITGAGFLAATTLTFGGVKATSFIVNSATQITATVPTGAVTGKITVKTAGGTASSSTSFTVQ